MQPGEEKWPAENNQAGLSALSLCLFHQPQPNAMDSTAETTATPEAGTSEDPGHNGETTAQTNLGFETELPDGNSFTERREIQKLVERLGEPGVRGHDELSIHDPSGEFNFDLSAQREGSGVLYHVRRKTVGELVGLLMEIKKAKGLWHNERPEPRASYHLPFGAPIPPATSAQAIVSPGGNEGWFVRIVLMDRARELEGLAEDTRYRQPMTWDATTTKYHREDPAREVADALNETFWDLGSTSRAAKAWTEWHERGRWESYAAETLRRISEYSTTEDVRESGSTWDWPSNVRKEATDAARTVGYEVAQELLGLPSRMRWSGSSIPGQYA